VLAALTFVCYQTLEDAREKMQAEKRVLAEFGNAKPQLKRPGEDHLCADPNCRGFNAETMTNVFGNQALADCHSSGE
jgi:hypothetical protein